MLKPGPLNPEAVPKTQWSRAMLAYLQAPRYHLPHQSVTPIQLFQYACAMPQLRRGLPHRDSVLAGRSMLVSATPEMPRRPQQNTKALAPSSFESGEKPTVSLPLRYFLTQREHFRRTRSYRTIPGPLGHTRVKGSTASKLSFERTLTSHEDAQELTPNRQVYSKGSVLQSCRQATRMLTTRKTIADTMGHETAHDHATKCPPPGTLACWCAENRSISCNTIKTTYIYIYIYVCLCVRVIKQNV